MKGNDTPIPELDDRTWAELEVVEHEAGQPMFKDTIRRRKGAGWEEIPVRVRVPRGGDHLKARKAARAWFKELDLDPKADKDLFDEVEQFCILSRAIREPEPPHAQFADAQELVDQFDEGSLSEVLDHINVYKRQLDPRDHEMSEDEIVETIIAIRRCGHLGPLTGIAGPAQPSFLLSMAYAASTSPTVQSYAQSRGISMQGPLDSETSGESSTAPTSGGE